MNNKEIDLQCKYNSRASFHGKARTIQDDKNNKLILISYSTEVAYIQDGKAFVLGQWSMTTTTHIKEFLKMDLIGGRDTEQLKELIKGYEDIMPKIETEIIQKRFKNKKTGEIKTQIGILELKDYEEIDLK